MLLYIGIGVTWAVCIIGGITYQKKIRRNKPTIKVFNLSDRAIKHKKYQMALNERTKGFTRR